MQLQRNFTGAGATVFSSMKELPGLLEKSNDDSK
jgi:hypothetical protein